MRQPVSEPVAFGAPTPHPTASDRALEPHERISELKDALSQRALRAARLLSPVFTAGNLIAYGVADNPGFLAVAAITAAIGVSSAHRLRSRHHGVEFLIVASGIGFTLTWPAVPDMVRGSLSAALVLFPLMGSLLLPRRARARVAVLFAVLILGQSAWAFTGWVPASVVMAHVAVSLLALFFGLRAARIYRLALEESEERAATAADRFRILFERVPVAIWEEDWSGIIPELERLRASGVTDVRRHLSEHPSDFDRIWSATRYIDVNPAGIALVGASSSDEAIANVQPEPPPSTEADAFLDDYAALWDDVDHLTVQASARTVAHEERDLQLSWVAGRHPDGSLDLRRVIVAMTDVTGLRVAERRLDRLLKSKDELVAAVSHELRTPLTGILGLASEVRDQHSVLDPEEVGELLALIVSQSAEVTEIIDDLLIAARADLGSLAVRPTMIDVRAELDSVLAMPAWSKVPTMSVPWNAQAWADSLRFRQIVRNLISNADRYGGPNVAIDVSGDDRFTVTSVIDDGDGIPDDEVEIVFAPFGQASATSHPGSVGLGLPVARRLARLMGGDLTYRYDGGSVFELRLPASADMAVGA